ncbi:MAG: peptide chain release factor N(5)-glutamine methyltransferase [Deltaproteobacteria bacterium]|nr:peptide chain release factor N(5)-glutamine methyltransferase [Deltaproteobacteria bacterium]
MARNLEQIWTIRAALVWTSRDFESHGISSPRLDAELLISRALGLDRVGLYTDLERPLHGSELSRIRELVLRRRRYEPVAYILGQKEFYGRVFEVTPDVLIPRPDTETLIDRVLDVFAIEHSGRVLDLGTGSGAIAVTLAAERPGALVDATDISSEALEIAKRNAKKHSVEARVAFYHGDLFEPLSKKKQSGNKSTGENELLYDVIVSNPPYIAADQWERLSLEIRRYEPEVALRGGDDGCDFYRRLRSTAVEWLAPGGSLMLEVGKGQAALVIDTLRADSRFEETACYKDFSGIERVVGARKRVTAR